MDLPDLPDLRAPRSRGAKFWHAGCLKLKFSIKRYAAAVDDDALSVEKGSKGSRRILEQILEKSHSKRRVIIRPLECDFFGTSEFSFQSESKERISFSLCALHRHTSKSNLYSYRSKLYSHDRILYLKSSRFHLERNASRYVK